MSATKPATIGAPYTVPPEPNRTSAIALAVAVHALLLAFLWIGISWQNTEPPAVEAEVWDMKVESAAAPALPPPPPPQAIEPEPQPEPAPVAPPPPKVAEPEPVKPAAPDINLEREKKLAEQKKQREREQLEKKEREREELKAKELAEKKELAKKELEKKELAKKELEKKELEKKKLEAEKKLAAEKAEAEKKKLADKAAKEKADKAEQAKLDKLRDLELKRITGAAGTSGSAQKSSAPKNDAGYQAAIAAKVKSNANFTGSTDAPGNPRAVFKVEQLPTGEILSVRLTKSSGVPQFDEAVERAINKSSPLPLRKDGTVERTVVVGFSMKDLD